MKKMSLDKIVRSVVFAGALVSSTFLGGRVYGEENKKTTEPIYCPIGEEECLRVSNDTGECTLSYIGLNKDTNNLTFQVQCYEKDLQDSDEISIRSIPKDAEGITLRGQRFLLKEVSSEKAVFVLYQGQENPESRP